MAQDEITSAVESFVDKVKDAVSHKNPPKDEKDEGKCPKNRRKKEHSAVDDFRERIERALQGKNAAKEIMDAVWQLLRDLGIEIPHREPKRTH